VSNFRPVKRAAAVLDVFRMIRAEVRARLLLVGEGPDLGKITRAARDEGLAGDVAALGEQDQVLPLLSISDLFLLPSAQESFGLAALEAMACRVPVVASRVGGLPEVIEDGVSGYLCEPDDLRGMADRGIALLTDGTLHARVAAAARRRVKDHFCAERIVPRYEAFYEEMRRGAGVLP
jgi:N-acetyl-alpha-D-glucosaminyl L-malate synthase BshA